MFLIVKKFGFNFSLRMHVFMSLLAHAMFYFSFVLFSQNQVKSLKKNERITVEIVSPAPLAEVLRKEQETKPEEIKKIVETSSTQAKSFEPVDAKLLGEKNQFFAVQTIARQRGVGEKSAPKKEFVPLGSKPLALNDDNSPAVPLPKSRGPSQANYQPIDYIDNLDVAEETHLSTKEFKNFEYYSELRRMIDPVWRPIVKERIQIMKSQGRTIHGKNQTTKILLTLGRNGKLIKVEVIGTTEYYELDESAVETIRTLWNFPQPPESMIDPDGNVKVRWDFVLEVSAAVDQGRDRWSMG
jgi:TonB family protein